MTYLILVNWAKQSLQKLVYYSNQYKQQPSVERRNCKRVRMTEQEALRLRE